MYEMNSLFRRSQGQNGIFENWSEYFQYQEQLEIAFQKNLELIQDIRKNPKKYK